MEDRFDRLIIGAGLYGLYAALFCAERGMSVVVLERDPAPFMRATYINQARIHQGYHYPRSIYTASKSAANYRRFLEDYPFCINDAFRQVYATSSEFSWTNADQFVSFCEAAGIFCQRLDPSLYFNPGLCDGAFLTEECTYDADILCRWFVDRLSDPHLPGSVRLEFSANVVQVERGSDAYRVRTSDGRSFTSGFLLNATYASVNEVMEAAGFKPFKIKYEKCEIILCKPEDALKGVGITVMDGPFFSIMPFGCTGLHSLTSVTFTPHETSYDALPTFPCQLEVEPGYCTPSSLGNCNECTAKPMTSYRFMASLAKKYLKPVYGFSYDRSLYSMKPILSASEVDESRPTVIRVHSQEPTMVSVLSGKINTVYDLDEVLLG